MKKIIIAATFCLLPLQAQAMGWGDLGNIANSIKDATIGDALDAKTMFDFELPADYIYSDDYRILAAQMCRVSASHKSYEIHVASNRETFLKAIRDLCYQAADYRAKGNKYSREKYMPKIYVDGQKSHTTIFRRGI